MVDIFAKEGISAPRDIFAEQGITPPSLIERNTNALTPMSLDEGPEEVQTAVQDHRDQYEALAQSRYSQEQISEIRNKGPIGFWEARNFLDYEDVLPGGGLFQAFDTGVILNAGKKLEAGEELSVNEQATLDDFIDKNIEMNLRGMKVGGGIMYYGSQMPAFMTEFAATAGIGKLAQKGAQELVEKGVQKAVLSKSAGVAANVAARTAAMPTLYTPAYAERRLNDFMAVTDKGSIVFKDSEESPAVSALKAYGHTSVEVASELSGAALGKYIVKPVAAGASKYLKTPMVTAASKLPASLKQNLYKAYQAINPNARVSKVFSAAGWNGMLEELGEERVADILHATLDLSTEQDFTFDGYLDAITPSKDQLLIEAGIISIAGGVKTSADIAFNLMLEKTGSAQAAREAVDNMSATEQQAFVEKELPTQKDGALEFAPSVSGSQMQAAIEQDAPEINDEESAFNQFYREFINSLQPIEDATKLAEERGLSIDPGKNPFLISRTYAGVIGNIEHNLQIGTTKLNPETGAMEVTGKAMKSILDDFDNSVAHVEGKRDARETDFNDYLIARRTIEDLQDREDVKVSEKALLKATEDMARLADKYGEDFTWFDTFAQEMYDYQRRVLFNLVDAQVLSEERYNEILELNPNYIPFQRVIEDEFKDFVTSKGVFTNANANKVIKKIQGSDKDIKTTTHSVIANTAKIIDLAWRNRVAKGLADLEGVMPDYIQKMEGSFPPGITPRGSVTVFRDGKREFYKVSKPLQEAVKNLSPVQLNATFRIIMSPFQFSARLLRAGATIIPEFWIRNVIRDQGTALLQSPVRPTPIDMVQGLAAVIGKTELYHEWMRNGGSFNSYMDLDDKGLEKAYKELFRPRGKMAKYLRNPIMGPLKALNDISMALEQGTRVGVFKKAREQGVVGMEAALLSREATLDFARGGPVAKQINQYVPFFNAGVQSVDKLARTFKENPAGTMFWGMATVTIPSVMLTGYYLYGAPEEERQEYLEIPQWQKDLFWIFKEDGQWRRIPKPFSFGYIFGSVPERFMTWGFEGDKPEIKDFWEELVLGVVGTISPVYDPSAVLPPLVKVIIEDLTNYNFFTGRNVYPEWMDRYEPEQRKNKFTSETAVQIGRTLGVSPALVDNTLRGSLAGSANYVTDAGDKIIKEVKKWNGEEIPEEPVTPADIPIVKAFSVREPTGYRAVSVSNFFDTWKKVNEIHATSRKLEGDERADYLEENAEILRAHKPMKAFYDRIRTVGKLSDRIYEDPAMSSEEKVEQLSEFGDQILETAKTANEWFTENIGN